jgi:hypothetical protein
MYVCMCVSVCACACVCVCVYVAAVLTRGGGLRADAAGRMRPAPVPVLRFHMDDVALTAWLRPGPSAGLPALVPSRAHARVLGLWRAVARDTEVGSSTVAAFVVGMWADYDPQAAHALVRPEGGAAPASPSELGVSTTRIYRWRPLLHIG